MKWLNKKFIIPGLIVIIGITGWGIFDHNLESKNTVSKVEYKNSAVFVKSNKTIKITDKTLAYINNGDLIYPRISPNGKLLVYAEAVIEMGKDGYNHEYTQIKLYNIEDQTEKVLLDKNASKQYAYFSAFVTNMKWLNNEQIEAKISNGDTGITTIKFDLPTKCVIKTAFNNNDILDYDLPPAKQMIFDEASNLFPDFDKDVLRSAIESTGVYFPDSGLVLLQKLNRENIIWFMDLSAKKLIKLVSCKEKNSRLEGGFIFQDQMVILVANDTLLNFYTYQNKKFSQIASFDSNQGNISLEVKNKYSDQQLFLLRIYDTFEKGNNPLFIYDGKQLIQILDCQDLYDVDISKEGQKVVFCFWEQGERHLVIKELK